MLIQLEKKNWKKYCFLLKKNIGSSLAIVFAFGDLKGIYESTVMEKCRK